MNAVTPRALAVSLLSLPALALAEIGDVPSGEYSLDNSHGYVLFSYSHLGFSNPQVGFDSFDVTLDLDTENPADSEVQVSIDATSVNSRVAEFNEHLNGERFFDTANYPTIEFVSTDIVPTSGDQYEVTGNLTIKDITRPVTLEAVINKAGQHPMLNVPTVGISAQTTVKRSDWGLDYAVPAVSDEVTITIEVEMLQPE
jgi:polyisoprenoid-binding protein YceI